MSTTVSKLSK